MVTFSGVGSGLDMSQLIDGLVAVERQPIRAIESRKAATNQRISTIGDIVSKLKALEAKAKELDSASELVARSVESSAEQRVTATASSTAVPGPHEIRVISLAAAQIDRSTSFAANASPGDGSFEIRVGADAPVTISFTASETLDDIARTINESGARVAASVVHDGSGYRLIVTGKEAGTANAISLTNISGASLGLGDDSLVRAAADASLELDGLPITRTTNTISDLIPGVTLQLHSPSAAGEAPAVVTVSEDPKGLREKLAGFVEAYNEVAKLVSHELSKNGDQKVSKGQLLGDSTLRNLQRQLGAILSSAFPHGGNNLALGSVGISLASNGTISIDADDFDKAYRADPNAIGSVFAGGAGSLTSKLIDLIADYTESGTGILTTKKQGLASRVDDFDKQVQRIEARAAQLGQRLRNTFSALDRTVSALQLQQQHLLSLFGGLG